MIEGAANRLGTVAQGAGSVCCRAIDVLDLGSPLVAQSGHHSMSAFRSLWGRKQTRYAHDEFCR